MYDDILNEIIYLFLSNTSTTDNLKGKRKTKFLLDCNMKHSNAYHTIENSKTLFCTGGNGYCILIIVFL